MKDPKDFYFNPLNKINWGPDERSASEFYIEFLLAPLILLNLIVHCFVLFYEIYKI